MIFIKGSIIYIPVGQNTILCTLHQKKNKQRLNWRGGKQHQKQAITKNLMLNSNSLYKISKLCIAASNMLKISSLGAALHHPCESLTTRDVL